MARLPKYDEPALGDDIALVAADERPNGLWSHVQQLLSSDVRRDMYEVKDDAGRVLVVKRVTSDTWQQVLDWEE